MKVFIRLVFFLFLSGSVLHGTLSKNAFNKIKTKNLVSGVDKKLIPKKLPTLSKRNLFTAADKQQNIGVSQKKPQFTQKAWNKGFSSTKINSSSFANAPFKGSNFFATKVKAEQQEHNNNNARNSYWKSLLGTLAAALVGGIVATMEDSKPDYSSNPYFKDGNIEELRKFFEYVYDPELAKQWQLCLADAQCRKVALEANKVTIVKQEPYIVVKGSDFDRVINAKIAEAVIKQNKLNLLGIPKKTILFDGKEWKVVTEQIKGTDIKTLSLDQVQQLMEFGEKTGFVDWKRDNVLLDNQSQKLFIIDTETRSFFPFSTMLSLQALLVGYGIYMTAEGRDRIQVRLADLRRNEERLGLTPPPPFVTADQEINWAKRRLEDSEKYGPEGWYSVLA